jgi:23S rRNA pseudouridine1911/1915/1917 synthase
VENNDDFLVLDKPAGLPTHPTLDNYRENAKVILETELAIPLYTTHRLDVPTQGLLIIAKSPEAQRQFNRSFSLARVEKIYRSLNEGRVANGVHTHFMNPESRVPKIIQAEENTEWWRCQLEVLRSAECEEGFAHEVKLMTGKTHQIRAQMSFLGAPIVGDGVYGAEKKTASERIALECFRLSFTFRSRTFAISRPKSLVAPPTRPPA